VNANSRRAEIIRILRGTKQTTAARLANTFNVSTKTIKRDILALTVDEGYPIDTKKGNNGGIILRDFNHPYRRILSQEQIKVLTEVTQISTTYQAKVLNGIIDAYS
jgi:predicted DNA-binding transcriptional regulator YafY